MNSVGLNKLSLI